ncbi:MAG TPA: hypothetical protein VGH80_07250 [Xanthomonadaceae bacterium]
MSDNPYASPNAPVGRDQAAEVPADVLNKIKSAWVAAVVSGSITLVFTIIAVMGYSMMGITSASFIDVALIFGLAFGIHRKSRTCAVIMLLYFVASKILQMEQAGAPRGIVLAVIFTIFFVQGVIGTFKYHSLMAPKRG